CSPHSARATHPPRALHSFPTRRSSDLCSRSLARNRLITVPPAAHAAAAGRTTSIMVSTTRADPAATGRSAGRKALTALRTKIQRSEEHTSELQSHLNLVCRLLLEKKKE